jgi:hypothetical protein
MENRLIDVGMYQSLVGSLRYLVNTRPDLSYSFGIVGRYMEAPGKQHWAALKQILQYVQGSVNLGCVYKAGTRMEEITGYSESDHAGDMDDRRSTLGLVFLLGSSDVTWASQKQKTCQVAKLSTWQHQQPHVRLSG